MTTPEEDSKHEANHLLISVLCKQFGYFVDPDEYDDNIYSCQRAEKYNNVYFIKMKHSSQLSKYCMLARNGEKKHRGPSTRSYCVNIKTKKVMSNCFSSKCRQRGGGKYTFQDVETSSEDDDDDDDDDDDVKKTLTTSKRQKV